MPPWAGLLFAVVAWGLSFVVTKVAITEIQPAALIFIRALLGSLLLAVMLVVQKRRVVPPRDSWRPLAAMGFVGVAFHQMLQAIALSQTSAVNAGWLVGLTPIWSALFAVLWLGERVSAGKVLGLLLGFAGAALVVTRGRLVGLMSVPSTRGDLLMLASTVNWAFYSSLGHSVIRRLGATQATLGALFFGMLMLWPVVLVSGAWRDYALLSAAGWGSVLFLGLICSGLAYLYWYAGLEKIESSRVAAFLYVEPLVTLLAAAYWLGEPIGVVTLVGGALLLGGVALVQRS